MKKIDKEKLSKLLLTIEEIMNNAKSLNTELRDILQEYEGDSSVRDQLLYISVGLDNLRTSQSEFSNLLKYKINGLS